MSARSDDSDDASDTSAADDELPNDICAHSGKPAGTSDATRVECATGDTVESVGEASIQLVEAAAANLGASDAHYKQLTGWLAKLSAMPAEQHPPKPPAPDARKGSDSIRALRQKAHDVAVNYWSTLHAAWIVIKDARRKALSHVS